MNSPLLHITTNVAVPDDVTITTVTSDSTSITVQWSYPSPSTSYTGFRVIAAPSTGAQHAGVDVAMAELSTTLSHLYSGTEYDVTVFAVNEDQFSCGVTTGTFTCKCLDVNSAVV